MLAVSAGSFQDTRSPPSATRVVTSLGAGGAPAAPMAKASDGGWATRAEPTRRMAHSRVLVAVSWLHMGAVPPLAAVKRTSVPSDWLVVTLLAPRVRPLLTPRQV